jgi:hypothetical protein
MVKIKDSLKFIIMFPFALIVYSIIVILIQFELDELDFVS